MFNLEKKVIYGAFTKFCSNKVPMMEFLFLPFFLQLKKARRKKSKEKNSFDLKFSFSAKPKKENAFKTIVNF